MSKPTTSPAAVRPVGAVPRLSPACGTQAVSPSPAARSKRGMQEGRGSRARGQSQRVVHLGPRARLSRPGRWYTTPMPIYEFCCNACGTAFEELVRNGTKPECPECHSGDVCRLLSTCLLY